MAVRSASSSATLVRRWPPRRPRRRSWRAGAPDRSRTSVALEQLEQVLHVGDVLRVHAVADDADHEREAADEQAEDRDGERGDEVLGELGDVAAGQAHERRRQRDQRAHEAQHGAEAHEDARPLEPLDRVELVLLQQLERLRREPLGLVVADEVVEKADDDQRVVVLLQVPVGGARLAVGERLAGAQGADLEGVEVAVAEAQPELVQQDAELDEHPHEADDDGDEDGPEEDPGDVVDELLKVVHWAHFRGDGRVRSLDLASVCLKRSQVLPPPARTAPWLAPAEDLFAAVQEEVRR